MPRESILGESIVQSVRLPKTYAERAKQLEQFSGCPVSETIRRALLEYLDKHQPQPPAKPR